MRKRLIALVMMMGVALGGAALWMLHGPAPAKGAEPQQAERPSNLVDFSHWAVVLVAGDFRAHSGAPSKVFDNGRRDLAQAFAKIGFSKANMLQFSVDYDNGTQHASIPEIAAGMQSIAARARDGCLIYFTSHGTPEGIVVGEAILGPSQMREMVASACGGRPSVIVMSSCYSGQFVAQLAGDNRVIMTAARPDRTSFGCGEMDHYTFFDDCFLRAMPMAGDFPSLGGLVQQCVAERERQMKATPPSEPQVSVGPQVIFTLRWRDGPAVGNKPT
ncbi:MAG TPA: C13 family peptidase [Rhizomicrobium sp.]|nr:C13 family peptidase [Rhizomicrobium sp.]